jgi:phosphate transport system substrate-binding protein
MSTPSTSSTPSTPDKEMVSKPKGSQTTMWAVIGVVIIVVILVVVGFEAGWFGKSSSNSGTCTVASGQAVTGAGSTFVYPLMYTWETSYTQSSVSYSSVGSGTGISDLAAKSVDFAASDAPLSPAQQATAANVITMPESAGAVSIIYNVAGAGTLDFNGTVLADIYLGTITMWNAPQIAALNPTATLPAEAIGVVHRSDGSGTSFAFTEYLSAESPTWKSTVGYETQPVFPVGTGQKGSGALATYVENTPGAIGYVDLEYALTNGISFGRVLNPAGDYVLPSLNSSLNAIKAFTGTLPAASDAPAWYNVSMENAAGAASYPITTFTYLISYADLSGSFGSAMTSGQASAMLTFWNWTIHQGQSYSGQLYYVPLPANIVTADQAELSQFTYNGAAVAHC